jgi:hypothetical protein
MSAPLRRATGANPGGRGASGAWQPPNEPPRVAWRRWPAEDGGRFDSVGTLRRECLDHLLVVNERHRRAVLRELVRYDNVDRPPRSLVLEPPQPAAQPGTGPVRSRRVLGGLHHVYERAA